MWLEILLLIVLVQIIRWLLSQLTISNLTERSVFITGCDTGFGNLLSLKCCQNGMQVYAGCYTEKGADELKKGLQWIFW